MTQQYQVRFVRIPRWLMIAIGAFSIAFAIALLLLSLTVFLLILPVIAVVGAVYYFFGLPRRAAHRRGESSEQVIEGEYRIVQSEQIDRERR